MGRGFSSRSMHYSLRTKMVILDLRQKLMGSILGSGNDTFLLAEANIVNLQKSIQYNKVNALILIYRIIIIPEKRK